MRFPYFLTQASLITILLVGCGPADRDAGRVPVAGKVWIGGRPAERGSVAFHEDPPQTGQTPIGTIDADGSYRLYLQGRPGAMPGAYRVTVFINEPASTATGHAGLPKSLIDPKYTRKESTPLRIEVAEDGPADGYDLNLR